MTEEKQYLEVTWERFKVDTLELIKKLPKNKKWSSLVAITRGGLIPAAILAQELEIRVIETLCITSYQGEEREECQILKGLDSTGEDMLVVDDLTDSGGTFKCVRQLLPKATLTSVYAKPLGMDSADFWGSQIEQESWMVFPWEKS